MSKISINHVTFFGQWLQAASCMSAVSNGYCALHFTLYTRILRIAASHVCLDTVCPD